SCSTTRANSCSVDADVWGLMIFYPLKFQRNFLNDGYLGVLGSKRTTSPPTYRMLWQSLTPYSAAISDVGFPAFHAAVAPISRVPLWHSCLVHINHEPCPVTMLLFP